MDFVTLNFETADETRFSVCKIDYTVVKNGLVVKSVKRLVKPSCYPYFEEDNIDINGISPDDVSEAPSFPEVWNEVYNDIQGKFLLMHNTGFHASVLRYTLDHYAIDYPNINFGCTSILGKKVFPALGVYRFDFLAKKFGVPVDPEYPPKQSSERIAELAKHLLSAYDNCNLADVFKDKGILAGRFEQENKFTPCLTKRIYRSKEEKYGLGSFVVDSRKFNTDSIFFDSEVVFTGSLDGMTRKEALQKIAEIGGRPGDILRTTTNYLVCGKRDMDKISIDKMTGKYKKAIDFASKGHDIEIIDEDTFLQNL